MARNPGVLQSYSLTQLNHGENRLASEAGESSVNGAWTGAGKVRAREADGVLELVVDGLTTQAKYYKPLIYEFFRKEWRGARPAWGDHSVEIDMDYVGEAPWLDLDNLAKAILDAIKGYAFHDDAQVSRLLVERRPGERERIVVRVRRL
jgi:crossover junction endodeoxyribonuclease RusA